MYIYVYITSLNICILKEMNFSLIQLNYPKHGGIASSRPQ